MRFDIHGAPSRTILDWHIQKLSHGRQHTQTHRKVQQHHKCEIATTAAALRFVVFFYLQVAVEAIAIAGEPLDDDCDYYDLDDDVVLKVYLAY